MYDSLSAIIERDAYNSILYLVLGGLLLLSVFHLVMFFQNRDRAYLLYSSYTFFSFVAYMPVAESGFADTISQTLGLDYYTKVFFTIVFNCIYFFFFTEFLAIKKINIKWYRVIVLPVFIFIVTATVGLMLHQIYGYDLLFNSFKNIFIYLVTIQTVISFYILSKVSNNLKYYVVFGGLILFACSVIGDKTVRELPWINLTKKMGDFIFFLGLFIENIAFSFALGHKQRIIYHEKVAFQQNFISQLQKNEMLKDEMNRDNEKRLIIENEKIKYLQEISDLKLSVLQSQMNPHFIFNALNSIKYYILENDTLNAVDYLSKFSKIIRTILSASTEKEFTLAEELQTIQLYVDIENLRFNNHISFSVNIAPEIDRNKVKLPPMVLQPFIENSILHGVATIEDKKISIDVSVKNNAVEICITDNGIGRSEAGKRKSIIKNKTKSLGTEIAAELLKNYFNDQKYHIQYIDLYEEDIAKGTKVVIAIPKPRYLRNKYAKI